MWRALFESAEWLHLPIIVMIGFVLMFVGVIVRVVRHGRRGGYDEVSRLPLEDDLGSAKVDIRDGGKTSSEVCP